MVGVWQAALGVGTGAAAAVGRAAVGHDVDRVKEAYDDVLHAVGARPCDDRHVETVMSGVAVAYTRTVTRMLFLDAPTGSCVQSGMGHKMVDALMGVAGP